MGSHTLHPRCSHLHRMTGAGMVNPLRRTCCLHRHQQQCAARGLTDTSFSHSQGRDWHRPSAPPVAATWEGAAWDPSVSSSCSASRRRQLPQQRAAQCSATFAEAGPQVMSFESCCFCHPQQLSLEVDKALPTPKVAWRTVSSNAGLPLPWVSCSSLLTGFTHSSLTHLPSHPACPC